MDQIRSAVLAWYHVNKRPLPWRETTNPYEIWLSEVILQQTRVDQGLAYYYKFLNAFPSIFDLASADEQAVLSLWQGLGYYSRARNLHQTAQQIVLEYAGKFPENYEELLKLKGIGPYTAAAIASFAFGLPHPVLDGNVFRVLSRIHNWSTPINSTQGKKEFETFAQELLDRTQPGMFNQAIMEFGALHCKPNQPLCNSCPIVTYCAGFQAQKINQLPAKIKKQGNKERFFVFEVITKQHEFVLLEQRKEKDIWQHLYQFPLKEFESRGDMDSFLTKVSAHFFSKEYKHILSHQHLFCHFILREALESDTGKWVKINDLNQFPIPRAIDRFLEEHALDIFRF